MNILDHRILIPTSPETVWEYISHITNNPGWQVDCKNVSFVSTRHSGVGIRWRYDTAGGHSYVVETTAWYDKLGYEYTIVDGTPFRENKGRIRLQEIAEGTIVQWTFSYETGGLFGGVRNTVATKRHVEGVMVESLRSLWSAIQKSGKNVEIHEVKSLMRDALDYEARSTYKPRHPSNKVETPPPASVPKIVEPPVSEEDTRPRQPTKLDTAVHEPVFLSSLPGSETPKADTAEQNPLPAPPVQPVVSQPEQARRSAEPVPVPAVGDLAPTEEDDIVPPDKLETARELLEVPTAEKDETQENLSFTTTVTTRERPPSTDEIVQLDTSEVSVFDVFGVPRPSQTQEMEAVSLDMEARTATLPMPVEPKASIPLRIGLRLMLRRRRLRLRRPV
jgi:polyketide cyclase/dehydrase/lipid transport protein